MSERSGKGRPWVGVDKGSQLAEAKGRIVIDPDFAVEAGPGGIVTHMTEQGAGRLMAGILDAIDMEKAAAQKRAHDSQIAALMAHFRELTPHPLTDYLPHENTVLSPSDMVNFLQLLIESLTGDDRP